jgi:hypothetical protein
MDFPDGVREIRDRGVAQGYMIDRTDRRKAIRDKDLFIA